MHAGIPQPLPPGADTPREQTPPGADTPPPPGADNPPSRNRHPPKQTPPREQTPPWEGDASTRSMSGRYVSYWNAFLFKFFILT